MNECSGRLSNDNYLMDQLASSVAGTIGSYIRKCEKSEGSPLEVPSMLEKDVEILSIWADQVSKGNCQEEDWSKLRYAFWPNSYHRDKNNYYNIKSEAAKLGADLQQYKTLPRTRQKELRDICLRLDVLSHPIAITD